MRRAIYIKVACASIALLIAVFVPKPLAWGLAAAILLLGAALLLANLFDVNSSFWAKTLWRAPRDTNAVALTFDDGPDPEFTAPILAILEEKRVLAAFFVVGVHARAHPELLAKVHRAGHSVGNHSDTHDLSFHFKFWGALRREVDGCNAAIAAAIGRTPALFRSPQGFKSPALGDVLRENSMIAIGWQVRGRDAVSQNVDAIVHRIVASAKPGGVILLHDGAQVGGSADRSATLAALPVIIDRLRATGLRFVRLDELLEVEAYRYADCARANSMRST